MPADLHTVQGDDELLFAALCLIASVLLVASSLLLVALLLYGLLENKMPVTFQTPTSPDLDRSQHVWICDKAMLGFKCVLCGGVTRHPSNDVEPDRFEPLTPEERALCLLLQGKANALNFTD